MLIVGVVIAAAWAASRWWCFGRESERWVVMVDRGALYAEKRPAAYAVTHGWWMASHEAGMDGAVYRAPAASGWMWFPSASSWPTSWRTPPIGSTGRVFLYEVQGPGPAGGDWYRRQYALALWPVFPVLFAGGWLLQRSGVKAHRRIAGGCCLRCGYDLAGLAAGAVCPECGRKP